VRKRKFSTIVMEEKEPSKSTKKYIKKCTVQDSIDPRYLFLEERRYLSGRYLEKSHWYKTNQSNQKYVPYYDMRYTTFETTPPNYLPSHPRERHRCDFHVSDILQSVKDRKASVWGCTLQLIKCLQSEPGEEPERLREEYWING